MLVAVSALYALFSTLDPQSISQALAFYEAYPSTVEGERALQRAQSLLGTDVDLTTIAPLFASEGESWSEAQIALVESLGAGLANRSLKGYRATSEEEILQYNAEDIDLGIALILSQGGNLAMARQYSARLDWMALQVRAYLSDHPSPKELIQAINTFLFEQQHIKFPPQSVFMKDIDRYTLLASVMDNHLGVCLGVTTVYLAIAQRLSLPLEIITPPGHIFVRYREGNEVVNIETTARGIHVSSESYLGVNTYRLPQRNMKEVVGMTHVNQASVYLQSARHQEAKIAYEKAQRYLPDDGLVKELLGYACLFTGEEERGRALLREVCFFVPDYAIAGRRLAYEVLEGKVDLEGVQATFAFVDDTRESLLNKKKQLLTILEKYPDFSEGYLQLGVTWIQLGRGREALAALSRYHELYQDDPQGAYYLAVLHHERQDDRRAWEYLAEAESLVAKRLFSPQALKELKKELCLHCPQ